MRYILLKGFAIVSVASALAYGNVSTASATEAAVCSQTPQENSTRCEFASLAQCKASISGRGGTCFVNSRSSFARMGTSRRSR